VQHVLTDLDLVDEVDAGYAATRVVQQGARAAAASLEAVLAIHRVTVAGGVYSLAAARAWLALGMFGLAVPRPRFHGARLVDAPADATFVEIDGVHVRYRDVGEGNAVVLVHGYGASSESWMSVVPSLRAHRVIAVDLKGFGWSSRPAGDYSPAAQAQLVWRVLDALGVEDAALVGHSWGASVVLAMAVAQPTRVRRVALYAAYVYDDQVPPGVGELLFGLYYKERVEGRVALAFADDRFVTQNKVDRLEAELARPGTVAAALATARRHHFSAMHRALRTFDRPVLLLWGEDDQVTPLRFGHRLAGELANARLCVYPQCGHVPPHAERSCQMVEAHAASTADLVAFLDEDGDQP
jgi:pimeloyl-ACP methyl ester carboxylesterase